MKLDLNKPFITLTGEEKQMLGNILAEVLVVKTPGIAPIKALDWALELHKGNSIEIDKSDLNKLSKVVESNENLTNIAKAQLLKEMASISD